MARYVLTNKFGVKFFGAIGAYAVAKLSFGSVLNVLLYPLPKTLIISNVMATCTDWDEALQGVYFCQRKFQLLNQHLFLIIGLYQIYKCQVFSPLCTV